MKLLPIKNSANILYSVGVSLNFKVEKDDTLHRISMLDKTRSKIRFL